MDLYTDIAQKCSKLVTRNYSTSFSLGIRVLDKKFHAPIYGIYGFVRYADEIVDTFHDHDQRSLLQRFKEDTYRAIEEKISLNPVLHAFQLVVNKYAIERELIDAFLESMEMDLTKTAYDPEGYSQYIYGSAEVVGLMCLHVFCEGNHTAYQSLVEPARSLGSAFQKVNFLRDIKSDHEDRGRVYFPGVDFMEFKESDKIAIEAEIQTDFDKARDGIRRLPQGARLGVFLAYRYYLQLFKKIRRLKPRKILTERVRIPDSYKALLLLSTYFRSRINAI